MEVLKAMKILHLDFKQSKFCSKTDLPNLGLQTDFTRPGKMLQYLKYYCFVLNVDLLF